MFQTTNQVLYILVVEYWIIPYIMENKIHVPNHQPA